MSHVLLYVIFIYIYILYILYFQTHDMHIGVHGDVKQLNPFVWTFEPADTVNTKPIIEDSFRQLPKCIK